MVIRKIYLRILIITREAWTIPTGRRIRLHTYHSSFVSTSGSRPLRKSYADASGPFQCYFHQSLFIHNGTIASLHRWVCLIDIAGKFSFPSKLMPCLASVVNLTFHTLCLNEIDFYFCRCTHSAQILSVIQRYLENHSTVALKDPSLPALTFGSLKSPRTANPCVHPSKYSLLYPGSYLPSLRILSASSWALWGNCSSKVQLLISRGALASLRYRCVGNYRLTLEPMKRLLKWNFTSRSSGALSKEGWETTETVVTPSNAISKT